MEQVQRLLFIMREAVRKVLTVAGGCFRPLPSLFDLAVAGFLGIVFIKGQYIQSIFFIFYIIFLYSLTIGLRYRRNYKSLPLALLTIWALIGVFVHSYFICQQSITMKYLNMYLMSEGFIYILFGVIFIKIVITYSTNLRFAYLLLPFAMSIWWTEHRATIWMALIISTLIYLLINKKFKILLFLTPLLSFIVWLKWNAMMSGYACRPIVWKKLTAMIIQHPFVGMGFDNSLRPSNAIFDTPFSWGGIYMHNDLLNIGRCLGVLVIVFILWFIFNSVRRIGKNWSIILFLTVVLTSLFQMTMFIPAKAAVVLTIIALVLTQTYKQEAENV